MKNQITVSGSGYAIQVSEDARQIRQELMIKASTITTLTDANIDDVRTTIKELASFRLALEKSRKQAKEPVLEQGKAIDSLAKEFGQPTQAEEDRLESLLRAYAIEVERKRREREEEERKITQELARKEAELRTAEEAKTKALEVAVKDIFAEPEPVDIFANDNSSIALEVAVLKSQQQMTTTIEPLKGAKMVVDYEVVDANELAHRHPQLVTITPKRSETLSAIRAGVSISGIRTFEKMEVRA